MKNCRVCFELKHISEFYIKHNKPDSKCKKCVNKTNKKWELNNKEKMNGYKLKYNRKYKKSQKYLQKIKTEDFLDKKREYDKQYRINNLDKLKSYITDYYKENYPRLYNKHKENLKNNPEYKLKHYLRNRIRKILKGHFKPMKFIEGLGCTAKELKMYLENKFDNNMNWENYGKYWHVDHIIPLSSFNLLDPEQFKQANNYKNLQPLEKTKNLKKSNKLLSKEQLCKL